jgi:hypothetical protein
MAGFRCSLVTRDGASRRVDRLGVVIGRDAECEIVVRDPAVSRRHAWIRVDVEGCELVVLGRTPVACNGAPCDRTRRLVDGDELQLGELVLRVELARDDAARAPAFFLLVGSASYGISHTPFALGGGPSDDLALDGWPPRALAFHVADSELFVEPGVPGVTANGVALETGELAAVAIGDLIGCAHGIIAIGGGAERAHTTVTSGAPPLPSKIVVEMLPRGGRVVFSMPGGDHCVYFPDRRLDLITALLRPPHGYLPGDFIPDDVLRPMVWPGNPGVIRSEINVHITRCRRDLIAAGLAGPRLLERAPGGGATRLALGPSCDVVFL